MSFIQRAGCTPRRGSSANQATFRNRTAPRRLRFAARSVFTGWRARLPCQPLRQAREYILTVFTRLSEQFADDYGCLMPQTSAARGRTLLQPLGPASTHQTDQRGRTRGAAINGAGQAPNRIAVMTTTRKMRR